MRRFLSIVLCLFGGSASAQVVINPGGGGGAAGTGGITAGAAATGCSAFSYVYVDTSGNLACARAPINGATSTAGTAITSQLETITGASATSNWFNLTGTFPSTLSAETTAMLVSGTFDNDAQTQSLLKVLGAGTADANAAVVRINNGASIARPLVVEDNGTAVFTIADGGDTTFVAQALGKTVANSCASMSFAHTGQAGSGMAYDTTNAALTFARNGTCYAQIQSVGTAAFTVDNFLGFATSIGAAADTYLHREAAATLQMGVDVNGAAVAQLLKAHDGITGTDIAGANFTLAGGRGTGSGAGGNRIDQTSRELATGTTAQTLQDRTLIVAKAKALTESAATSVVLINVASGAFGGGEMEYTVQASDATDHQARSGRIQWSVVNKAGTETCTVSGASEAADSSTVAASAGTLTYAITTDTSAANGCYISFNAVSSLTQTVLNIAYRITANGGTSTFTAQ